MESKHFFSADNHYSHGNILKYSKRVQFMNPDEIRLLESGQDFRVSQESVGRMNRHLIDRINETVGEQDTLWILGDFCFPSNYKTARYFRLQIVCRNVHLIFGNHDKAEIAEVFDPPRNVKPLFNNKYNHLVEIDIEGVHVVMQHYCPSIWNKSHRGAIALYGHSHGGAEEMMDQKFPNRRSVDVGVDNAAKLLGEYRPFRWDEIKKLLLHKRGEEIDHHRIRNSD